MPVYTCERCLKEFTQKSHFNKHLQRKNPCQNIKGKIQEIVEKMVNEKLNIILNKESTNTNNNTTIQTNTEKKTNTNNNTTIQTNTVKQLTFDHDYNTIKNYYNNILNKDKTLVETSNDEPTPIDCVKNDFKNSRKFLEK